MQEGGIKPPLPFGGGSEAGQVFVEMGYGADTTVVIFQGQVFVRGVGIFVGKTEADQDAGYFESVVHLRDERD